MGFLIPKDIHYTKEELKEHKQINERKDTYYGPDRSLSKKWIVRNAHWVMSGILAVVVIYSLFVSYHDEVHKIYNVNDYRIIDCVIEEDTDDYTIRITYQNPSSKAQIADIYRIISNEGGYVSRYDLTIDSAIWDMKRNKPLQTVLLPGYASSTVTYRISKEDMPKGQEMTLVTEAYEPQEYMVTMPGSHSKQ